LTAERAARQQAEARASGAEAMVTYLKLLIAKMKRDRFGQSAERRRKLLDQLELQLEELEASATGRRARRWDGRAGPYGGTRLYAQEAGAGPVAGSPAA
jgi:transposase